MIRIKGQIGEWPVDLEIELGEGDWARLGAQLVTGAGDLVVTAAPSRNAPADDPCWAQAQQLLREAGALSGPQLLAQLEPLAGSVEAAKRLLVRLRHCPQVCIEQQADAPLYRWVG